MAAVSGVISSVSWELVKLLVATMGRRLRSDERFDPANIDRLRRKSERDILLRYIREYYLHNQVLSKHVSHAIAEELLAHETTDILMGRGTGLGAYPKSKDEFLELCNKAIERLKQKEEPSPEDFINCWKNVDLSG